MNIRSPKVKTEDLLFYIAYGLFLISGILSTSFYYVYFMSVYSLIKYFCIFILIAREFYINKYSIRGLVIGGIFIALILITRSQSSVPTVAYILIFIFCARNVDFKNIAKFTAWTTIAVVAFVVVSGYIGIIDNYNYSNETRTRFCLGFRYPLYGPAFLFNITGLFIYIKKKDIKWITLLALSIANIWMFLQTDARLSFGLAILLVFVSAFLKIFPDFFERKNVICYAMISSFVLCFVVSFYFTATYDSDVTWQNDLNEILGGRLELGKTSLEENGVSMFGQEIHFVGNGLDAYGHRDTTHTYNYVDSFYIQVLQRYGILFSAIWLCMLTYTLYRYYKAQDYWMMVCLSIVAIHCVVDDLSLDLCYNTFWFACTIVMSHMSSRAEIKDIKDVKAQTDNSNSGIEFLVNGR